MTESSTLIFSPEYVLELLDLRGIPRQVEYNEKTRRIRIEIEHPDMPEFISKGRLQTVTYLRGKGRYIKI